MKSRPLIIHAIHHLVMGGLENGLINLLNNMPAERYRHAILCLDRSSNFRTRLTRDDVKVYAMHAKPGRDPAVSWRVWRLFRQLRPDILHSRNLSGLDALLPAKLANVKCRIHGEHGWHDNDPEGVSRKYQLIRRLHRPLVTHYVALSKDLENYLHERVGVPAVRIARIPNGVDTVRFHPAKGRSSVLDGNFDEATEDTVVIGTIGRFEIIKDPMNLASAFVLLMRENPDFKKRIRLVMIGNGPEWENVRRFLSDAGCGDSVWLPGARDDVADILHCIDAFVMPSRGEGISNTILEAMACGLPVVATEVGGNGELVDDGKTGSLVECSSPAALAAALKSYILNKELRLQHGSAGRIRAEQHFSLDAMCSRYIELYDRVLAERQTR